MYLSCITYAIAIQYVNIVLCPVLGACRAEEEEAKEEEGKIQINTVGLRR